MLDGVLLDGTEVNCKAEANHSRLRDNESCRGPWGGRVWVCHASTYQFFDEMFEELALLLGVLP